MNAVVQHHLIELYKAVADAVDSGCSLPQDVHEAYEDAFVTPEVQAFYGELIDERTVEVFGKD